jgi:2-polyprenyl-3-methyl-5-hydroxy-6-metoxy-1,4-benzoquinol methylase
MSERIIQCPLCNSAGLIAKKLDSGHIKKTLGEYYDEKVPDSVEFISYDVMKCAKCSLEWASPLREGSMPFYKWITEHNNYYPAYRWEWDAVINQLRCSKLDHKYLLEIGCGSGVFLGRVNKVPGMKTIGLDLTERAIEQCRAKGIDTHCKTIDAFVADEQYNLYRFDYVVAFHCLEHVAAPKQTVLTMLKLLKPSGRIYLSTPFSPMSFEYRWHDPLNYPPHHLTRWNIRAYEELAKQLDLQINFSMPRASGILDRTLYALNLAWNGPSALSSRKRMLLSAFINPLEAAKEFVRQSKRVKVAGKVAADVILVELSQKK